MITEREAYDIAVVTDAIMEKLAAGKLDALRKILEQIASHKATPTAVAGLAGATGGAASGADGERLKRAILGGGLGAISGNLLLKAIGSGSLGASTLTGYAGGRFLPGHRRSRR